MALKQKEFLRFVRKTCAPERCYSSSVSAKIFAQFFDAVLNYYFLAKVFEAVHWTIQLLSPSYVIFTYASFFDFENVSSTVFHNRTSCFLCNSIYFVSLASLQKSYSLTRQNPFTCFCMQMPSELNNLLLVFSKTKNLFVYSKAWSVCAITMLLCPD